MADSNSIDQANAEKPASQTLAVSHRDAYSSPAMTVSSDGETKTTSSASEVSHSEPMSRNFSASENAEGVHQSSNNDTQLDEIDQNSSEQLQGNMNDEETNNTNDSTHQPPTVNDEMDGNSSEQSQRNMNGEETNETNARTHQPPPASARQRNDPLHGMPRTITPADIIDAGLHRNRRGIFMRYLFITMTVRYTAFFKSTARRLIEFFSLSIALLMFLVLLYIHVTFIRNSGECLNHVKDVWPPNGILRVQITPNKTNPAYQLIFAKSNIPSSLTFQSTPYDVHFRLSSPIFPADIQNYVAWRDVIINETSESSSGAKVQKFCPNPKNLNNYLAFHVLQRKCPIVKQHYFDGLKQKVSDTLASVISDMYVEYYSNDAHQESLVSLLTEIVEYDIADPLPIRKQYAIEYSVEFGYLRLSTNARFRLGVPTLIVNLDPDVDSCFGSGVKHFVLKTFLGYDDFLMSSIKKLAEGDKSQGYLRNLITGEYFRFVTVWINHTSGILAFLVMVLFSLIVSMLLRYSYHQIFVFMMEVLRILDTDARVAFPAAPMLTIVLALVGMEEIMTEFFHDSTVAFYVILLVWSADQYDTICLHTNVGRRHWARFFYLYHFAFYLYNYKFNGQYSKLALFTSWLFIFHSMIYFFHHYEIPAIQRQIVLSQRMQQIIWQRNRNPHNRPPGAGDPMQAGGNSASDAASNESMRNVQENQTNQENSGVTRPTNSSNVPDPNANLRYYIRTFFANLFAYIFVLMLILSTMISVAIYNYIIWSGPNFQIMRWSM